MKGKGITIIKEVWTSELGLNHTEGASQIIKDEYIKAHGTLDTGLIVDSIRIEYGYFHEETFQSFSKIQLTGRATIIGILTAK